MREREWYKWSMKKCVTFDREEPMSAKMIKLKLGQKWDHWTAVCSFWSFLRAWEKSEEMRYSDPYVDFKES